MFDYQAHSYINRIVARTATKPDVPERIVSESDSCHRFAPATVAIPALGSSSVRFLSCIQSQIYRFAAPLLIRQGIKFPLLCCESTKFMPSDH